MQKTNLINKFQTVAGLLLFFTLAGVIVALCISNFIPAVCAAAFWIAYITVCAVATKKCEEGKSCFILAWAMVGASVILLALSPLALILWVVETLVEKTHKSR